MAKYVNITNGDMVNGEGIRVTLWFAGCEFRCENCHNSQLWDKENGIEFDYSTVEDLQEMLSDESISGLSILGGEPLTEYNRKALYIFLPELYTFLHKRGKNVWLWTGYNIEEIAKDPILKCFLSHYVDVLIAGRYIDSLQMPVDSDSYFGSSNQKLFTKEQFRKEMIKYEEECQTA